MRSLPLFHRLAGRPVVVLGEGAAADARRRLVDRAGGIPIAELSDAAAQQGARLAFIAHDDAARCAADAAAARTAGLLVNVTDRPELCDFTVPSLLERDPVLVAIGTDGASAGLAKQLRLRLEALLPANLGALAGALAAARNQISARWPAPAERRRALDAALVTGGPLDPLAGSGPDRVAAWLVGRAPVQPPGVHMIHLASGDPDDLTLRQARLLGSADAVLHDAAVPPELLHRARADALRVPLPHAGPRPEGLVVVLRLR